jgi:hypothetical protein
MNEKTKFNKEIHFINYISLYENEILKREFTIFLKKEVNTAPFFFQLESKEIILKNEVISKKMELLKQLCQKYILTEGINQINLESSLQKDITEICKKDMNHIKNSNFFIEVLYKINKQLYVDLLLDSVFFYFNIVSEVYQR